MIENIINRYPMSHAGSSYPPPRRKLATGAGRASSPTGRPSGGSTCPPCASGTASTCGPRTTIGAGRSFPTSNSSSINIVSKPRSASTRNSSTFWCRPRRGDSRPAASSLKGSI
jgi:hypothetical protein